MVSHEIDYKIYGDDIQEAGTMVYMEQAITFEVRMGDGSEPSQSLSGKLFQAGSRLLTGEPSPHLIPVPLYRSISGRCATS